jgi:hypothetical protein
MTSPKTAPIAVDQPFLPHETLGYALKRAQQAMRQFMTSPTAREIDTIT